LAEALLAVTEYASQKVIEKQGNTYLNEKWADFFKDGNAYFSIIAHSFA
jgi:hypothetical protein